MAVFAVDAGGTRIKLAVVADGIVIRRAYMEAFSGDGLACALPRIGIALRGLLPTDLEIEGIGMAFPSLIEGDRVIGDVGKYRDAEVLDLPGWAQREFGVPFAIENDARLATIGEWQFGAGKGTRDMVMVTLGTGIGTGVISEGRVLKGRHGSAGILGGHMTARVGGRLCACGNVGCWETEASTAALPAMIAELDSCPHPPLDYAAVFAEAAQGKPCATQIRDRSLEVWGALAVSLIHAYDPELLVFGGGVLASGEAVLGPIRETVRRSAWSPWGEVEIVASQLGDDAALVACEWLVQSRRERQFESTNA